MPRYKKRYRKTATKKVWRAISSLNKKCQGEMKQTDREAIMNASSDYGTVANLLSNLTQGDGAFNSYEGAKIRLRSVLIRGKIVWDTDAPNSVIRLVLFRKNGTDNTTPEMMSAVAADTNTLLEEPSVTAYHPMTPLNYINKSAFTVLWDELLIGNPDSVDAVCFKKYINLNHDADTGGVQDQSKKGTIFLGIIGDQTTVSANYPVMTMYSRVRFVDN